MKPITQQELVRFVELTNLARNDYYNKQEYRNLGRKILKYIAKALNLQKGDYEIRFNAGGQACSGDNILHHKNFYLNLSDNLNSGWFYYRICNGLKDYSGGPNIIYHWDVLLGMGIESLINKLSLLRNGVILDTF